MKVCTSCGECKPFTDFRIRARNQDGLSGQCRDCLQRYESARYRNLPARKKGDINATKIQRRKRIYETLLAYLKTKKCVDCGETDIVVFEFDHVRGGKEADISNLCRTGRSWAAIQVEIEKCEVVCANCHRRRTAGREAWTRNSWV